MTPQWGSYLVNTGVGRTRGNLDAKMRSMFEEECVGKAYPLRGQGLPRHHYDGSHNYLTRGCFMELAMGSFQISEE